MKRELSIDHLTAGLPTEFATYMHYVRNLNFLDVPDYEYMRRLFRTCMVKHQFSTDCKFDWSAKPVTSSIPPAVTAPLLAGVAPSYVQPSLLPSLQTLAALEQQHRVFSADPLTLAPSMPLLNTHMHQLLPSMAPGPLVPTLVNFGSKPIAIAPATYPPLTVSIPQASIKQAITATASSITIAPAVAAPTGPTTRKRKAAEIEPKQQPQRNVRRTRATAQK